MLFLRQSISIPAPFSSHPNMDYSWQHAIKALDTYYTSSLLLYVHQSIPSTTVQVLMSMNRTTEHQGINLIWTNTLLQLELFLHFLFTADIISILLAPCTFSNLPWRLSLFITLCEIYSELTVSIFTDHHSIKYNEKAETTTTRVSVCVCVVCVWLTATTINANLFLVTSEMSSWQCCHPAGCDYLWIDEHAFHMPSQSLNLKLLKHKQFCDGTRHSLSHHY